MGRTEIPHSQGYDGVTSGSLFDIAVCRVGLALGN